MLFLLTQEMSDRAAIGHKLQYNSVAGAHLPFLGFHVLALAAA
jgi:hypothetical protein